MELIIKHITGKTINYSEVTAPYGYCFYDKDEEERNYMVMIFTPVTDEVEIRNKYVLVEGSAEKLNEEVHNNSNAD